ncbi:9504_t:CDS:2, partial [Funneliformis mosseae]
MATLYNDTRVRRCSTSITTTQSNDEIDAVSKALVRMPDEESNKLKKFRKLWFPYTLVEGVSLEEYERRGDVFNVHGFWEWFDGKVKVTECPSRPHEICISKIVCQLMDACRDVTNTDAEIYNLGSTRTRSGAVILEKNLTHHLPPQKLQKLHQMGAMET